jgi:hypothetical protein
VTDLSGTGVRILLMGTATHQGPTLTPVPAVARTMEALRLRLVERCRVNPEQIRSVLDPPDARTMAAALAEQARLTQTVLLVYYLGHGLLGSGGELYLAASNTDQLTPGLAAHQALSFSAVREALGAARASAVVVVLDCCFSGRASLGGRRLETSFTLPPTHGMYLLSSAEQLALAPADNTYTTFTGELINLLDHGDPRGPHLLTLDAAYDYLFRALRAKNGPLPRRQAGDQSGGLVLATNPAQPTLPDRPVESEPAPGRCPYPGLAAFDVEDAEYFHGRDQVLTELLDALSRSVAEPGPVVVVGPSGSGKTSLLHAGLLAGLRGGAAGLPGSAGWPQLVLTPGADPLERLAARLHPDGTAGATSLRDDPGSATKLLDTVRADRPDADRPDDRLVLVVDQFEELFTLCRNENDRAAFVRALAAIAGSPDEGPVRALVVLALRADFYGHATAYPELVAALRHSQVLLRPMSAEELRAAIEAPAAAVGLRLDEGLADVILHELGATRPSGPEAGALPLLSHSLWATWQRRAGARLTLAGYRASGGITKAVATTADETYASLDPAGQRAVRHMLPRLVQIGDETADTARPVDRATLLLGLPDPEAAEHALRRLADARLITLDRDAVRISHEALLHAWPLLGEWIEADRDWLRIHQQLSVDARAWQEAEQDPSLLYRGSRLAAVQASRASVEALEPPLVKFLDAAQRQERRVARARTIVTAVLSVLLLVAVTAGIGAALFQRQAVDQRNRAVARLIAAEAEDLRDRQPGLAKQLSLVAYRMDREAGAGAIFNSQQTPGILNGQEHAIDLAQSKDGSILAISTGAAVALRAGAGRALAHLDVPSVGPITLSPNGRLLVAGVTTGKKDNATSQVRLWNIEDPTHPKELPAQPADTPRLAALAISSDGRVLVNGTESGAIQVWDITDPTRPRALSRLTGHTGAIQSLAFAATRRMLVSSSADQKARLWDLSDPTRPAQLSVVDQPHHYEFSKSLIVHTVAFSSNGKWLVAAVEQNSSQYPRLWDIRDPRSPHGMEIPKADRNSGGCSDIRAVVFNLSGSFLAESCYSERYSKLV